MFARLVQFFEKADKRERRRRMLVHTQGRLGEAYITGSDENALFYAYSIAGVQYEASQDITSLRDKLPTEPQRLLGVASFKYLRNNPANSILVCEEWCGVSAPRK